MQVVRGDIGFVYKLQATKIPYEGFTKGSFNFYKIPVQIYFILLINFYSLGSLKPSIMITLRYLDFMPLVHKYTCVLFEKIRT